MKYSPEYYELLEQNNDNIKTVTLKVNLKADVDGIALYEAVQKAARRYPYLALKVTRRNGDIELSHNDRPIKVMKRGGGKIVYGSPELNGHFTAVEYEEKSIYFCYLHALAGPSGFTNYVKTVLFVYLNELYGGLKGPTDLNMPESAVGENERAYFTEETLRNLDTMAPRKVKQGYRMHEEAPFSEAVYYEVRMPQKEFVGFFKMSDGSPTAAITALMYRALRKYLNNDNLHFVASIAHEYSDAVGCKGSTQNMIRSVAVQYPPSAVKYDYGTLMVITRGQIILGTQKEMSAHAARLILGSRSQIDQLPTLRERQDYALRHNLYGETVAPSFLVSCPGTVNFGDMEPYIDSFYPILEAPLGAEINASQSEFFLTLMLTDTNSAFLPAFLSELTSLHIPYSVKGPFHNGKIGIEY